MSVSQVRCAGCGHEVNMLDRFVIKVEAKRTNWKCLN